MALDVPASSSDADRRLEDSGEHRGAALHHIHEAEHELREALRGAHQHQGHSHPGGKSTGTTGGTTRRKDSGTGTPSTTSRSSSEPLPQQQLGNAMSMLKQPLGALHQAKHDDGGHREQAVYHIERAIHQLEKALHEAR